MFDKYLMDQEKIFTSINSPPGVFRISSAEEYHNQLQSMGSWCDENFESEEAKVLFGTPATFVGLSPYDSGGGQICHLFATVAQDDRKSKIKIVKNAILNYNYIRRRNVKRVY
jgi:beta-carotene ketolase (CrtO type)